MQSAETPTNWKAANFALLLVRGLCKHLRPREQRWTAVGVDTHGGLRAGPSPRYVCAAFAQMGHGLRPMLIGHILPY